jgi:putative glutamine amidotransferase
LDQALSADLSYDKDGKLIDAVDEHGILTPENAKKVKRNTWQNSNVEELMDGVDCIVFPGGSDICPTLYYNEQEWHGIEEDTDHCAERDVSDYILLSYCLEQDIPMLAICRGMQMLSVVSGADMIQDISQWISKDGIEYHNLHRDPEKKDLVPHQVTLTSTDSLIYRIVGTDSINAVPSWHHQAAENVDNTRLVVTALTETDGKQIIEAVERPDKTFCIGVQFHPEVAVRKHLDKEENEGDFMEYDDAMAFFNALLSAGEKRQNDKKSA